MTLPSSEDAVLERQQAVRPARSGSDKRRQCRPREETALKALLFLRPGTSPTARGLPTPQTSICLAPGGRPARRLSVQIWSGLSRRDSGGTRQVPWAQGGNLKNLLLSPGAGPKCAPGNPRAVLSGFLPGKKKKKKTKRTQTPRASALPREGSWVPRPSRQARDRGPNPERSR